MSSTAEDFPRQFSRLWTARDAKGLSDLFSEDADFLSLTGLWCEGKKAIEITLAAEFAGVFARARMVTGRCKVRPLDASTVVLHQRFVLSGLTGDQGQDMGRLGALMIVVLTSGSGGWHAVSLQLSTNDG